MRDYDVCLETSHMGFEWEEEGFSIPERAVWARGGIYETY
jgi:hypothetical protein